MSENNDTNRNVSNDEIDLLELLRRMGHTISKWLNALGKAFMISLVFLLRRWLPLGLSVIAGLGLSYLLRVFTQPYYSSDIVLKNNIVSNDDMISYINKLHQYCMGGDYEELARLLKINNADIDSVFDISAYWIIDNNRDKIPDYVDYKNDHNVYDTINVRMQDRFDVRVMLASPQELGYIKDGLIRYIESDSLFQQRNRIRLRHNSELISRSNYDISQLDSLQKVKYFEETRNMYPKTGGQMIFLQEQKTQLLYPDIYSLYSKRQQLETEKDLYGGLVTVLSDFTTPIQRDNGGLYYAKMIIPLFFGITLIILIIVANKKKIKEIFEKY